MASIYLHCTFAQKAFLSLAIIGHLAFLFRNFWMHLNGLTREVEKREIPNWQSKTAEEVVFAVKTFEI